jgi:hypothetical protein
MKLLAVTLLLASLLPASVAAGERFACNMAGLTGEERARHQELSRSLFASIRERRELPGGYAFRMPPVELMGLAEWVSFERRCCPFLTFEIEQTRDQGPLWLRITGSDGVKPFIVEEFELAP